MTQENAVVQQAQAQVAELQEQVTEAGEQGATPQQIAELQAELDKAKSEINRWQSEAKGQQRAAKKTAQQLEDWQAFKTGMESQIGVLAEMVADLMDRNGSTIDDDDSTKRKSTNYREKFKSVQQSAQTAVSEATRQRVVAIANEAEAMIKPAGLNMTTSPELRTAYALFRAGDYEEALEETKKVVNQMTEAKKEVKAVKSETPEEMEKRIREEVTKKIYAEKGFNLSDVGGGSSSKRFYTNDEIADRDFYEANKDDILKARQEGRIKVA